MTGNNLTGPQLLHPLPLVAETTPRGGVVFDQHHPDCAGGEECSAVKAGAKQHELGTRREQTILKEWRGRRRAIADNPSIDVLERPPNGTGDRRRANDAQAKAEERHDWEQRCSSGNGAQLPRTSSTTTQAGD